MENTIYRPVARAPKSPKLGGGVAPSGSVSMEFTKLRVDRMREALASPSTLIPNGLTIEQMRVFILSHTVKAR